MPDENSLPIAQRTDRQQLRCRERASVSSFSCCCCSVCLVLRPMAISGMTLHYRLKGSCPLGRSAPADSRRARSAPFSRCISPDIFPPFPPKALPTRPALRTCCSCSAQQPFLPALGHRHFIFHQSMPCSASTARSRPSSFRFRLTAVPFGSTRKRPLLSSVYVTPQVFAFSFGAALQFCRSIFGPDLTSYQAP